MTLTPPPRFDETLDAYRFELPESLIASIPGERGSSRLMVIDRKSGAHAHHLFSELPDLLPEGALLVANNSRVLPARLIGKRATGGKTECLLLTPLPLISPETVPRNIPDSGPETGNRVYRARAEGLIKPSKPVKAGDVLCFDSGLHIEIVEKGEFGKCTLMLEWTGDLKSLIETHGHLPLPPYMKREAEKNDSERYQTTYAREDKTGSVAAPTAGLHFTDDMRQRLVKKGFAWEEITLHVGYGTFSPVRSHDIRQHVMHEEYVEVTPQTVSALEHAQREKRPVIAVGTTAARALEGIAARYGSVRPHTGWINIFINPGFEFRVISGMITNFHLPESTLLMLVSALAGRSTILEAYRAAVESRYRFFSYGDAMLIRP